MRVQTHIELTEAYKLINGGLDPDNLKERSILLNEYNYSVIVEGEWMELENLEKWIIQNIDEILINEICYGKTNYDFGFVEYFFRNKINANEFTKVVSLIYTTYPHSYPPGSICKSDGENKVIPYNSENTSAIVFRQQISYTAL